MRHASVLLLIALVLTLGACGDESGIDRKDPRVVAQTFVDALVAEDWATIELLMEPDAYTQFKSEMRRFQLNLAQPKSVEGSWVHKAGRAQLGKDWPAAAEATKAGHWKGSWSLLLRIQPMPKPAKLLDSRSYPQFPGRISWQYQRAANRVNQIDMVKTNGLWVIRFFRP